MSECKTRYDAPPPKSIRADNDKPDSFKKSPPTHIPALALYIAKLLKDGDKVLDVGCGQHPVTVKALETRAKEKSAPPQSPQQDTIRAVGVDLARREDAIKQHIREGIAFCFIPHDLNTLSSATPLDPANASDEQCRGKLQKIKDFIEGASGLQGQFDMLVMAGIIPFIDLGGPVDYLYSLVKPGGRIVVTGQIDHFHNAVALRGEGHTMADYARYLTAEGHRILSHEYCGVVVPSEHVLKKILIEKFPSVTRKRAHFTDRREESNAINQDVLACFSSQSPHYVNPCGTMPLTAEDYHFDIPELQLKGACSRRDARGRIMDTHLGHEVIVAERCDKPKAAHGWLRNILHSM